MPATTVTAEPPLRVPPAGLVPIGQCHLGGVVRGLHVAAGVFDRHLHRRGDDRTGGGIGGALDKARPAVGGPAVAAGRKARSCMTQLVPFWVAVQAHGVGPRGRSDAILGEIARAGATR